MCASVCARERVCVRVHVCVCGGGEGFISRLKSLIYVVFVLQESIEIKKSTGIPRSFMVPVEGPGVPGAMMTPTGQFAVPAIDQ